MENITTYSRLEAAIGDGDGILVRTILKQHADFLHQEQNGTELLRYAARRDNVEMMSILVEFGADVNASERNDKPEGAILDAAGKGARNAVRWLLDHGAKIVTVHPTGSNSGQGWPAR